MIVDTAQLKRFMASVMEMTLERHIYYPRRKRGAAIRRDQLRRLRVLKRP
jgi:hypothetical protein